MGIEALTNREKEIIKLISEGYNSPKIATLLNRSVRTIDAHRRNAMAKLGVNNAADMLDVCKQEKFIA